MEMIIGGAYQGKADYAKAQSPGCGLEIRRRDHRRGASEGSGCSGISGIVTRKALKAGEDLTGLAEKLARAGSGCDPCQ